MDTRENNYLITEEEMLGMTSLINRLQFFLDVLPANKTIQTDSHVLADTLNHIKGEIQTIHDNIYDRFKNHRMKK